MVDKQIDAVLKREGGYVHDPADRGGETNFGITIPAWRSFCLSCFDEAGAGRGMRGLTRDDAMRFYRWWWSRPELGLALLKSPGVQLAVFDASVLFGRGRPTRWLQEWCNGQGHRLVVDGVVGPVSAAAVNSHRGCCVVEGLHARRLAFHAEDVAGNPAQARFLAGWRARAVGVRDEALALGMGSF